jgi:hypothetical protein
MDAIEQAFQRHARPQVGAVPTEVALLQRARNYDDQIPHLQEPPGVLRVPPRLGPPPEQRRVPIGLTTRS